MHLQLISRSQYCNSRCLRLSWQFFPPQDLRLNIRGFFCRRFLDNSQMEFNFFDWSEPFARRPILWWRRWRAVFAFLIRTHFPSVNSVRTLQRQAIPVSLPPKVRWRRTSGDKLDPNGGRQRRGLWRHRGRDMHPASKEIGVDEMVGGDILDTIRFIFLQPPVGYVSQLNC